MWQPYRHKVSITNSKAGHCQTSSIQFSTRCPQTAVNPVAQIWNAGVISDLDMSFNTHIKQTCGTAFFYLFNIPKIRNILSQKDAEK